MPLGYHGRENLWAVVSWPIVGEKTQGFRLLLVKFKGGKHMIAKYIIELKNRPQYVKKYTFDGLTWSVYCGKCKKMI